MLEIQVTSILDESRHVGHHIREEEKCQHYYLFNILFTLSFLLNEIHI